MMVAASFHKSSLLSGIGQGPALGHAYSFFSFYQAPSPPLSLYDG